MSPYPPGWFPSKTWVFPRRRKFYIPPGVTLRLSVYDHPTVYLSSQSPDHLRCNFIGTSVPYIVSLLSLSQYISIIHRLYLYPLPYTRFPRGPCVRTLKLLRCNTSCLSWIRYYIYRKGFPLPCVQWLLATQPASGSPGFFRWTWSLFLYCYICNRTWANGLLCWCLPSRSFTAWVLLKS